MGWETRQGRGRYYTRTRRVSGQVVREYVGKGPIAEVEAALDAQERDEREARRQAVAKRRRAEQERIEREERPLRDLDALCDALVRAVLEEAGFHQHKRQWRRKRGGKI